MKTTLSKSLPRSFATFAALTILGACSTPLAPTITAAEFISEQTDMTTQAAKAASSLAQMPGVSAGTVTYTGRIGDADGSNTGVSGALSMDIDFATSGMTGSVSDLNYVDEGTPDQRLGGTVALTGSVSGTGLSGTGSGTLTAVESGFTGRSNVNLTLSGQFRNDASTADLITGSVSGSGSGDFDFNINSGSFYANSN